MGSLAYLRQSIETEIKQHLVSEKHNSTINFMIVTKYSILIFWFFYNLGVGTIKSIWETRLPNWNLRRVSENTLTPRWNNLRRYRCSQTENRCNSWLTWERRGWKIGVWRDYRVNSRPVIQICLTSLLVDWKLNLKRRLINSLHESDQYEQRKVVEGWNFAYLDWEAQVSRSWSWWGWGQSWYFCIFWISKVQGSQSG